MKPKIEDNAHHFPLFAKYKNMYVDLRNIKLIYVSNVDTVGHLKLTIKYSRILKLL